MINLHGERNAISRRVGYLKVHVRDVDLRLNKSHFDCGLKPSQRRLEILWHTLSLQELHTDVVRRNRVTFLRRLCDSVKLERTVAVKRAPPKSSRTDVELQGFLLVLFDNVSGIVVGTKREQSFGIADLRSSLQIHQRLLRVSLDPSV